MVTVVVATNVALYREAVALGLARNSSIRAIATIAAAAAVLEALERAPADVVLLDLPTSELASAVRAIGAAAPGAHCIAIAVPDDEVVALTCAEAGCAGWVSREASLDDLSAAVDAAVNGELRVSPRVTATLARRLAARTWEGEPTAFQSLTRREREIVRLIDLGCSNKEIAQQLSIEVATVKNHVHNLLEKLRVRRRGEAAARLRSGGAAARSEAGAGTRGEPRSEARWR